MARTSYFTGFPLNQSQSVYVEDVIRQLGDLYTDTEEILNTTIDARDQAQASAQTATSSGNIAAAARDDALVAKEEAQEAYYDAAQARFQAQQAAADAEGSSQAAANSAANAAGVLDQVTNLYGDATEIQDAVTTAVDAKDEAVQARDATIYALDNAEEIYGDTAALQLAVTQAENARDASQDAEALAEKWASEAEDVPVVPGQFSAKHWAAKASEELGQSALKNQNLSDLSDLKEARSNLGTFSSVADVQSRHIPPVLDSIRTDGYYDPGDGGGALYKRVASEPSHGGKIQSADGAWWELGEDVVNVLQFGAKRDAVPGLDTGTDDSAAFNALTEYLRPWMHGADSVNGYGIGVGTIRIVIPPGYYLMENSWNLTDFRRARNITIEGHGAVLIGRTPGYPVVDALDSRWLHFHGLTVHGSIHAPPTCGIQLGKSGQITAIGNNGFEEVRCSGSFTLAGFANFGCETTTHRRCRYSNQMPDASGVERFACVSTGDFFFLPTSQYKAVVATVGTHTSFTQNSFYACDFRNNADGSTLFISNAHGHLYDKGCYYVAFDKANAVIESTYSNAEMLTLHGHFENSGNSPVTDADGVKYVIWWRGQGDVRTLRGLDLETSSVHASDSVFYVDNLGTSSHISTARVKIRGFHNNAPNGVMFANMAGIRMEGELIVPDGSRLNLDELTLFSGIIHCDSRSAIPGYPNGTYQIHDRTGQPSAVVGEVAFGVPNVNRTGLTPQYDTFTPSVSFSDPGDLSVSYDTRHGFYSRLPGGLVYVEIVLRFTPTYTTSTGSLSIGDLPATAAVGALRGGSAQVIRMDNMVFDGSRYISTYIPPGDNRLIIRLNQSGGSPTSAGTSAFPSGTEYTLVISGLYRSDSIE